MRTNEVAKGTTLEASSCCKPMGHMSSCKRPMGHPEQTVLQVQAALKETLVSVTVASKGALKIQKPNGYQQKIRKKNKMKFSARSKRKLNSRNWRESLNFIENSLIRNEGQVFKRARFCKEKTAKRRYTYYTRKGQTTNGVRNTVPIYYRLWWEEKRKGLFFKVVRAWHRSRATICDQKMGNTKEKKRGKKSVGAKRRRKCSRRKRRVVK